MSGLTRRSTMAGIAAAGIAAPAVAQSPVTLKIAYPAWDTKAQEAAVTGIFAEYEKQNPNVKIELISLPFPVLRQRLVVSARAGDPPDVAYVDGRWVPEMAVPGLIADITVAAAKLDRADWFPEPWKGCTVGGRIFAIPDRIDPWLVYYNTELFEKAGITAFPKTMDELAAAAVKITGGGVYGWGLIGAKDASLISRFINFLYAFHGDLLTPDGKKSAFAPARLGRGAALLHGPAGQVQGRPALGHGQWPERREPAVHDGTRRHDHRRAVAAGHAQGAGAEPEMVAGPASAGRRQVAALSHLVLVLHAVQGRP